MIAIHRTAEERFGDLPDFPYEAHYRDWEGMRLAHLDVGPRDGAVILLLHGEPTWSFLWRHTIAVLSEAGYRCVAPDLPGFGRSDKPSDVAWYTYDRLVASVVDLLDHLDLREVTLVCHDWGGAIGLRVASTERPERFSRIAAMDTGIFDGRQKMGDAWMTFRAFIQRTEDLPVAMLVNGACTTELSPEVLAAYSAPFDAPEAQAGAHALPLILPLRPEDPGAAAGAAAMAALEQDTRPHLVLWGADDPVLPADPLAGLLRNRLLKNAPDPQIIAGASHFLPEDAGEDVGGRIAAWLAGRP